MSARLVVDGRRRRERRGPRRIAQHRDVADLSAGKVDQQAVRGRVVADPADELDRPPGARRGEGGLGCGTPRRDVAVDEPADGRSDDDDHPLRVRAAEGSALTGSRPAMVVGRRWAAAATTATAARAAVPPPPPPWSSVPVGSGVSFGRAVRPGRAVSPGSAVSPAPSVGVAVGVGADGVGLGVGDGGTDGVGTMLGVGRTDGAGRRARAGGARRR